MELETALLDSGAVDLAIRVDPEPSPAQPRLSNAISAAWEKYCNELGDRVKKDFESKACNDMAEYVKVLEAACQTSEKESWGFKILDWFEPLFKMVELFIPAASAAVQAYPNPGSLVLGGIVGILQITSRVTAYQKMTVQMLERMGRKARLLRDYERDLYSGDMAVHEALVNVYGDMLRFCHKAVHFLTDDGGQLRARVKGLKLILFRDFGSKLGPVVDSFEQHIEDVESQASLCDRRRLKALSDRQHARDEDVSQALAEFRDHAHRMDDLRIQLKKRQDAFEAELRRRERREDMKEALSWLSPLNFHALYDQRCEDQLEGTGSWLLTSDEYKKWKLGTASDLLWVTGKPGCGKSFLAAVVVNDLEAEVKDTTAMAYAFCQRTEAATQSSEAILGSLAKQIIASDRAIDEELAHQHSTAQDGEKPNQRKIDLIMNSALSKRSRTYLVIDALDECKDLLKLSEALLKYLQNEENSAVKIIILSRHDFDLETRFKTYPRLHPDLGANEVDLKAYIESLFTDETQTDHTKEIRDECIAKADGMFLWVKLLEQTLQRSLQVRNSRGAISRRVLETIKEIPPGLGSMYDRILQDIWDMRHSRSDALLVLLWVTHAKRPLYRTEMLDAVADYRDVTDLSDKFTQPSPQHLVAICANLVFIDKDGYFRLCHESVRGHLDNEPDEMTRPLREYQKLKENAEERLAKICLNYLLLDNFKSGPAGSLAELHATVQPGPFVSYAAGHWGHHVDQSCGPSIKALVLDVVGTPATRELSMQIAQYNRIDQSRLWLIPNTSNELHLLSIFGLLKVAETVPNLAVAELAQQADGTGTTPFSYALKRAYHDMCMWLIEKSSSIQCLLPTRPAQIESLSFCIIFGWMDIAKLLISADPSLVDAVDKDGRTPLVTACLFGMKDAANTLLDNGANVDLKDDSGDNPLITATIVGDVSLVQLLLDRGAEPNCLDKDQWSPLSCACTADNVAVAEALLKKGADTLADMPDNQSPFHVAARFNSTKVVDVLYKHPIKPPLDMRAAYPDEESAPLHVAAWNNSHGVAKALLKIGAPLDLVDCEEQTALFIAAARGYQETVEVLVAAGCDVEIQDRQGMTAIHAATSSGNLPVLLCILNSQTPVEKWVTLVNQKSTDGRTPLHTAVHGCNAEMIRTLLKAGADGRTIYPVTGACALHTAATRGDIAIARLLLEATRESSPQNLDNDTPLHMAAKENKADFIKQYIEYCAELNIPIDTQLVNNKKRTAFGEAVTAGCEAVANCLLPSVTDSVCDLDGNYEIHHAAYHGYENIVEALLTYEGVTHKGYLGRTPLYFAATQGHLGILRMLSAPPHNTVINEPSDKGLTPILSALLNYHIEAVEFILDNQPTNTIPDGEAENGDRLLHVAASFGNKELARRFLDLGCDGDAKNHAGFTPMHCAVAADQLEIVGLLLVKGFNTINTPTQYGTVCNMFAAEKGSMEMLVVLDAFGATYGNHDCVGRSTVHYAAAAGQAGILEYLALRGESLVEPDLEGSTPLFLAASEGYPVTVKELLSPLAGSVDRMNLVGETPLTVAVTMGKCAVIDVLVANGADPNHRDMYGLTPFEYATRRERLLRHVRKSRAPMDPIDQKKSNVVLAETIERLCKSILQFPEDPTEKQLAIRAFDSFDLSKALGHMKDYEAAKVCLVEAMWPSKTFSPFLNFRCDICGGGGTSKPGYICKSCLPWTGICAPCHEDYVQAQNKLPLALRELQALEAQAQLLRKAVPEGSELLRIAMAAFYFAAGQSWVLEMIKLYRQWESSHNANRKYAEVARPGQEFLKILGDMYTLLQDVARNDNEVSVEDRQRFNSLKERYRTHLRVHPVDKEPNEFFCSEHDYISVTQEDFDKAKEEHGGLDPESGLMTTAFLKGLIAKYTLNTAEKRTGDESNEQGSIDSPPKLRYLSRASTWDQQATRATTFGDPGPRRGSVRRPIQMIRTTTTEAKKKGKQTGQVSSDVQAGANNVAYRLQSNNKAVIRRTKTLPIRLDSANVVKAQSFHIDMKGTQALNALEAEPNVAEGDAETARTASQHQEQVVERTVTVSYVQGNSDVDAPAVAGASSATVEPTTEGSPVDGGVLGTTLTNEPESIEENTPTWEAREITSLVPTSDDGDYDPNGHIDQQIMRAYITVNDTDLQSPEEMLTWWLALKLTTAIIPGFVDIYVATHQERARRQQAQAT